MPGFLEVYGYYDEDLGAWGIDVSPCFEDKEIQRLTIVAAHCATTHLESDDNRNILRLPDGWTVQQLLRSQRRSLGCHAVELHRNLSDAWNDKRGSFVRGTPHSWYAWYSMV